MNSVQVEYHVVVSTDLW